MAERAHTNDHETRDTDVQGAYICYLDPAKLVDQYLYGRLSSPYIKAQLAKLGDWSMHEDSLWAAAFEGLERAAETWRPDGGADPRTWAVWGMRTTVRAAIAALGAGVKYHQVVGLVEHGRGCGCGRSLASVVYRNQPATALRLAQEREGFIIPRSVAGVPGPTHREHSRDWVFWYAKPGQAATFVTKAEFVAMLQSDVCRALRFRHGWRVSQCPAVVPRAPAVRCRRTVPGVYPWGEQYTMLGGEALANLGAGTAEIAARPSSSGTMRPDVRADCLAFLGEHVKPEDLRGMRAYYVDGKPWAAVAAIMGRPSADAARSRLARVHTGLQGVLRREGMAMLDDIYGRPTPRPAQVKKKLEP